MVRREGGEKDAYWGLAARRCASCKSSPALLYCRADWAHLCGTCDARVHGANSLASRQERVHLCELCEQAPASFTCETDADIQSSNPLARRHERLPLVPFVGPASAADGWFLSCPSADEERTSWLLPAPDPEESMEGPEFKSEDSPSSDAGPYLDLDYATSMDTRFHNEDGYYDIDFIGTKPFYGRSTDRSRSRSIIQVTPDPAEKFQNIRRILPRLMEALDVKLKNINMVTLAYVLS